MALVKKPRTTDKRKAASQRNGARSRGPATRGGKARLAAAHGRHGLYAQGEDHLFFLLGEDPAEFKALLEGLGEEFYPTTALQERLVFRLARVFWLMDRADRQQEGAALSRARSADSGRATRLHAHMMRLKMTAISLQSLARSVARPNYVTTARDLDLIKSLQTDPELGEMGEIALALFRQLQDPGACDEAGRPEATAEQQQKVLRRIKEIFGVADPPPQPAGDSSAAGAPAPEGGTPRLQEVTVSPLRKAYPHITEAQWEAREPVRQLLENILTRYAEYCQALHLQMMKEGLVGPATCERAAEFASYSVEAVRARRLFDAHLREARRLTDLLLKIQGQERSRPTRKAGG